MNIYQVKEAIKACREANLPSFMHGPPGVGKTEAGGQVAKELGIEFIPISAPLYNPVDILGLPEKENGRTVWTRPEILPIDGEGIILIDELPDSAPLMQKALYSLVLERRTGTHKLPDGWTVVAAGNRAEDKAMASTLPSPLITRFVHIGVCCPCPDFTNETVESADIDLDDFLSYAVQHFHPLVGAFLKFSPDFCYKYQAVPRTWEYVSKLLNASTDHFSFIFKEMIKGTVGVIVGEKFNTFVKLATKIPNIDVIIADPINAPIPEDKDIIYALVTALLKYLKEDNMTNIVKYGKRLSKEIQFFMFGMAVKVFPTIATDPEYLMWRNQNNKYLM